jgi:predicted RNA-binding Zn-ribbon protein involved in translation (DUF1610 family)
MVCYTYPIDGCELDCDDCPFTTPTAKLSGKGHVGFLCPKCEGELTFTHAETYSDTYYEFYECDSCGAKFSVVFEAKEWREE